MKSETQLRNIDPSDTTRDTLPLLIRDETETRELAKKSVLFALLLTLAILWMPLPSSAGPVPDADRDPVQPQPRVRIKPKPVEPIQRPELNRPDNKRVPMPETAPLLVPEPKPDEVVIEDPQNLAPADWDDVIDLPEAPERPGILFDEATEGLIRPVVTQRILPKYPKLGLQVRKEGYVILQAVLDSNGQIRDIEVMRGMAHGKLGFEQAAIEAVQQWTFIPGKLNGKKVDVRLTLKIDFVLNH